MGEIFAGFVICLIGGLISSLGFEFHWWSLIADNIFEAFGYGFVITLCLLVGIPFLGEACS